jgi:hypothetical protein
MERYAPEELLHSELQCLEALGRKRGAKRAGGRINLHTASEILIHDLRGGQLGRLTLETPAMMEAETIEVSEKSVISVYINSWEDIQIWFDLGEASDCLVGLHYKDGRLVSVNKVRLD